MNRLLCAILLLLLITPTAAQDAAPFPVLDEADIFADGVTVIERLPVLNFDNEARKLYYFEPDSKQWITYDFPSELAGIISVEKRSDGNYLIYAEPNDTFNADVNPEYVWLFDSDDGFKRPTTICNLVQALPNEGEWRFAQLDEEESYRFCNTETGEYTTPLSQEIVYHEIPYGTVEIEESIFVCSGEFSIGYKPITSPDGNWIVFEQCAATYPPIHTIYAYEIATDTINPLERTDVLEYMLFVDWLNNTTPIFRAGGFRTGASHSFFKVDVTQSDSRTDLSIPLYAHIPIIFDNPMRSYSVKGIEPANGGLAWGGWQVTEHLFATAESRVVAEYRFDVPNELWETGFVLFADESIIAVQTGYPLGMDFPLYIFDVQTGEFLYKNMRTSEVHVAANYKFLFCDWDIEFNEAVLQIVRVEPSNEINIIKIPDVGCPIVRHDAVSPDGNYIILADDGEISIFDIDLQENFPLIIDSAYVVTVDWYGSNQLEVSACQSGVAYECDRRYYPLHAKWLVQLDALDEDNS